MDLVLYYYGSELGLPPWLTLLVIGVLLAYRIGLAAFVVARTGRSPLWSLLFFVPFAQILVVWALAYARWPGIDGPAQEAEPVQGRG